MGRPSVFLGLMVLLLGRSVAAQTPAYGTKDYTVTTIAALGFVPGNSSVVYDVSGSLGRSVSPAGGHFYSALDIPAGSVIDFIGFNNLNDGTPNVMAIHLDERFPVGTIVPLFSLDNTPHTDWETDINPVPLGILWIGSFEFNRTLILDMEISPSSNPQYFGSVEVWWKRTVSPAPATATFSDVPPSSPQFKFVEALHAAGITAGCGGGNYCPNDPVTRGQMAVFIATALGLHWPD
jgi:hypothetical protein